MFHVLAQAVSHSGERIVQMVFIRFQYHLQRHFVVLVVARLVVDITIMQVPIATRRFVFIPMDLQDLSVGLLQVPNKQWGKTISGNNVKTKFPIAFTAFCMLSVSVNSSNGNAAESVFRNGFGYTNKTLSDWILRGPTSDATYFADYIAIGCQPQWGYSTGGSGAWALKFNGVYTAVVVGAPGFPAREFCGFTFDYTLTGWSFTAGYNSPVSYIRPTTTAISLGY